MTCFYCNFIKSIFINPTVVLLTFELTLYIVKSSAVFFLQVVQGSDSMVKNGITTNISVRHQCITVMSNYDKKSIEVSFEIITVQPPPLLHCMIFKDILLKLYAQPLFVLCLCHQLCCEHSS